MFYKKDNKIHIVTNYYQRVGGGYQFTYINIGNGYYKESGKFPFNKDNLLTNPNDSDIKRLKNINKRVFKNTPNYHIDHFIRNNGVIVKVDKDSLIIFMEFSNGSRILFKYKGVPHLTHSNNIKNIIINDNTIVKRTETISYQDYPKITKRDKVQFKFKDLDYGL